MEVYGELKARVCWMMHGKGTGLKASMRAMMHGSLC